MKKKLACLGLAAVATLTATSCTGRPTLLFLNWGEYIDESLIDAFEEEYDCNVVMDLGETNEIFYSKVRGGTTVYDVVCPSDYMAEKMYENGMLSKLDFNELPLYKENVLNKTGNVSSLTLADVANTDYRLGVQNIITQMDTALKEKMGSKYDSQNDNIANYMVPYLWGTWGVCFTTSKDGIEEAVLKCKNSNNQWSVLYDRSVYPDGTRIANYDSSNHAYFSACKYLGLDTHSELADSDLNAIMDQIKKTNFDAWGTDSIKKDIVAGNIDVGFMWTGDFLYYYAEVASDVTIEAYMDGLIEADEIYPMIDSMINSEAAKYTSKKGDTYTIGFDLFIPEDTIAFCDNLVMTKDSANKELAYKFIDFMSNTKAPDEESSSNSFNNTYYVDYDATTNTVYDDLVALYDVDGPDEDLLASVVGVAKKDAGDTDLYGYCYDVAIGYGFEKYYPKDTTKGKILANFDRKYVNKINTTLNNAKV